MTLDHELIVRQGRRTVRIEAEAVGRLEERIGASFVSAVTCLFDCQGRVIVTGVGKSGLIGKKLAATLASTGTPSFFVHSAEAGHGDLGMLSRDDVLIAISNSGETAELLAIIPAVKRLGVRLICLTGSPASSLAKAADVVLDIAVREEACPLGLAPTASTAAALAMGDALAVALLTIRGFREEDFALVHPGGSLGRRWFKIAELQHSGEKLPVVSEESMLREAIAEMTAKGMGMTTVVDAVGRLTGIITDGDLRRMITRGVDFSAVRAREVMSRDPRRVDAEALGATAVAIMERYAITALVVVDEAGKPVGVVHLHDLLKAGVV